MFIREGGREGTPVCAIMKIAHKKGFRKGPRADRTREPPELDGMVIRIQVRIRIRT